MAVSAGFLVDEDAEVLYRRHSGERLSMEIVNEVNYFLSPCKGQPGSLCWIEGCVPALLPFCKVEAVLL